MLGLDSIKNALNNFGIVAKQRYNTTKVEKKIKNYYLKLNEIFVSIGLLMYTNRNLNDKEIFKLFDSVDYYKNKIERLEKILEQIKQPTPQQNLLDIQQEQKGYSKLTFEKQDLILTRTKDGIQLVRFCPKCDYGNNPENTICQSCGEPVVLLLK